MELSEFNNYYLSNILENLSSENKTVVLLGDFNTDLPKYQKYSNISDFLDTMHSNLLLPHITGSTRVTAISGAIIGNIFSNNYESFFTSGNLFKMLSDYHAQCLLMVSQTKDIDNENSQTYRYFTEIENSSDLIKGTVITVMQIEKALKNDCYVSQTYSGNFAFQLLTTLQ